MLANRKEKEDFIIKYIDAILPGSENTKLYKEKFSEMSDEEFQTFMLDLKNGKTRLCLISPNFSSPRLEVERNLKIAKELGFNFFQKIKIPKKGSLPAYTTPIKYLLLNLPIRRQAQILGKKASIPEDQSVIDKMTDQPTGKSKGAKLSKPEIEVLSALGLEKSLEELLTLRGGDMKGYIALNRSIERTGGASIEALKPFRGEVKAKAALKVMLNGMHIANNL